MKGYYVYSYEHTGEDERFCTYRCDHQLYKTCTLIKKDGLGLAVIQQRFNSEERVSWWGAVDRGLMHDITHNEHFDRIFSEKAGECKNGLYPTIEVRKLMYAVGLKPLKKQFWETTFRDSIS